MIADWFSSQSGAIVGLFLSHLLLSVVPVGIALAVALPVGWVVHRSGAARSVILAGSGLLYTIPSLAMFVLMPLILHTRILDPLNVVIALAVYSFALLLRVVVDGLDSVPAVVLQSADAMGYRRFGRLLAVELPVSVPVIIAGLRVATVSNVSVVSVAALIGVPQLGYLFTSGLQQQFLLPIIVGIVLCAVLAVVLDGVLIALGRVLAPWRPTGANA